MFVEDSQQTNDGTAPNQHSYESEVMLRKKFDGSVPERPFRDRVNVLHQHTVKTSNDYPEKAEQQQTYSSMVRAESDCGKVP